jgi:amino acid transporter
VKRLSNVIEMLNRCNEPVMYPLMVTLVCSLNIFGIYTGVRLNETIPTAMYLIDILLAIIGLAIDMLAFRLARDIDSKSSELFEN